MCAHMQVEARSWHRWHQAITFFGTGTRSLSPIQLEQPITFKNSAIYFPSSGVPERTTFHLDLSMCRDLNSNSCYVLSAFPSYLPGLSANIALKAYDGHVGSRDSEPTLKC